MALVGTDEGRLHLLNPTTGASLGTMEFHDLVRCRPALVTGRMVAADCAGRVAAASLDGKPQWERQVAGPIGAGLAADDQAIFLATTRGEVIALRVADGRRVWRRRLAAPATGSLQVTADLVLVGLSDGRICAFRRPAKH
jgi:outer membrane protein assembly factor BamB